MENYYSCSSTPRRFFNLHSLYLSYTSLYLVVSESVDPLGTIVQYALSHLGDLLHVRTGFLPDEAGKYIFFLSLTISVWI